MRSFMYLLTVVVLCLISRQVQACNPALNQANVNQFLGGNSYQGSNCQGNMFQGGFSSSFQSNFNQGFNSNFLSVPTPNLLFANPFGVNINVNRRGFGSIFGNRGGFGHRNIFGRRR